jgi:hypothetical protein
VHDWVLRVRRDSRGLIRRDRLGQTQLHTFDFPGASPRYRSDRSGLVWAAGNGSALDRFRVAQLLRVERLRARILKQSVTNVARPSGATDVNTQLKIEGRALLLSIADNGRGFTTDRAHDGNGLDSMRRRVAALGRTIPRR